MYRIATLLSAAAALQIVPTVLAQNPGATGGPGSPPASTRSAGASARIAGGATSVGASASPKPGASAVQSAAVGAPSGAQSAAHHPPSSHMPDPHGSNGSNAVQAILEKFDATRDQIVQQRQALVNQLAAAKTDSERKAVMEQLRAEAESVQAQARATAKEIRAELQAMRRQRAGGG